MTEALVNELNRYADLAKRLKGWQLEFEPIPITPGPPWSYETHARQLAMNSRLVLDLGTGGGEIYSRILAGLTCSALATEEWAVNAPVASKRLRGQASLVRTSSARLPFANATFDLVLSRHEAIDPEEIARVLAPGGHFFTQQVIPDYLHELREIFPDTTRLPDHHAEYQAGFLRAGLAVQDAREYRQPIQFRELGHLVYNLVAAPWTIPNFGVESHIEGLMKLNHQLRSGRALIFTGGYCVLEVTNGAPNNSLQRAN